MYTGILLRLLQEHANRSYDLVVFVTPADKLDEFRRQFEVPVEEQKGDDLGQRMDDCFRRLLAKYERVVLVGSDIPGLDSKRVEEALQATDEVALVLGPSPDGGYYLIASRQQPRVFDGIPWSTDQVLPLTLRRLKEMAWTHTLLEEERDIDTAEDLKYLEED